MPTSITTIIEEHAERIEKWKVVADRYPDTTLGDLPDGTEVFVSAKAVDDMNEFACVVGKGFNGKPSVSVVPYVTVGEVRVYAPTYGFDMSWYTLADKLKRKFPDAYALIAKEIREYMKRS